MADLYWAVTRNCDQSCRHCYLECSPGQERTSMKPEDFQKAIGNLPSKKTVITLTGGEIFTVMDNLRKYLDTISFANLGRQNKIIVKLQSNGSFLLNTERENQIRDLITGYREIVELEVTSMDGHHDIELRMEDSNRLRFMFGGDIIAYARGFNRQSKTMMPVGRAVRNGFTLDNYVGTNYTDCRECLEKSQLTVAEDGSIYTCCFRFFQLPGNLITDPLDSIIERASKDARLVALSSRGPSLVAAMDNITTEEISRLKNEKKDCGLCYRLFGKERV